jgi:hypothetical protein
VSKERERRTWPPEKPTATTPSSLGLERNLWEMVDGAVMAAGGGEEDWVGVLRVARGGCCGCPRGVLFLVLGFWSPVWHHMQTRTSAANSSGKGRRETGSRLLAVSSWIISDGYRRCQKECVCGGKCAVNKHRCAQCIYTPVRCLRHCPSTL